MSSKNESGRHSRRARILIGLVIVAALCVLAFSVYAIFFNMGDWRLKK